MFNLLGLCLFFSAIKFLVTNKNKYILIIILYFPVLWLSVLDTIMLLTKLCRYVAFALNVQVFEAFGQVELVQLPLDETGHCKGFGFVQVSSTDKALDDC